MINGLAITAGSNPSFEASIGRQQPTIFAIRTTIKSVTQITAATVIDNLSRKISFTKFAPASVRPHRAATLSLSR